MSRVRFVSCALVSLSVIALSPGAATSRGDRAQAVETTLPAIDLSETGGVPWSRLGALEGTETLEARMAHYGVPGVSVAVVDDHALVWARGYGVTVAGSDGAVGPETLFEAGSTTKAVTAVATLRYVSRGTLDLDADVNEYLTSWRVPENEFTAEEKVTVRRLLTHTAGINRPDGGFEIEDGGRPTTAQVLAGEAPALNAPLAVEAIPGAGHSYSNLGYVLLQQVLQDVAGESFPALVRSAVFEPAGMTSSTFDPGARDELVVAKPHDPTGRSHEPFVHPGALAQGELRTTPGDLSRLAIAIMRGVGGGEGALLAPGLTRELLTVQAACDPALTMGFSRKGLGMFLVTTAEGMAFCHPGFNAPGATSLFIGIPATGQALVVMTNGARGLELSLEILSSVAAAYGWPRLEP